MLRLICAFGLVAVCAIRPARAADFGPAEATAALHKAVDFFRTKIAVHGGYVYLVSEDLKKREGEDKVSPTQVWIQPPATPSIGQTYLTAWLWTGDEKLLAAARETAECLIHGQLESGGWYVRIDFDPQARREIAYRVDPPEGKHKKLANRSTLDDDKTQSCIRFLMRLDAATGMRDSRLHEAVVYALDSLVKVQFPNGAWPQQFSGPPDPAAFPVVKASYPAEWSRTFPAVKYDGYYTFNDGSIADDVEVMLEAAETYGDSRYRAAAEKAGDFILLAQMPEPQPAWAQQYDAEMHPAWARKFEPPSITGGESQGILKVLLQLYAATGNKKYLAPVPKALAYLKKIQLPDRRLARFYELHTDKPLYFTKDYVLTYSDADLPTHYGFRVGSDLDEIQAQYDELAANGPPTKKGDKKKTFKLTSSLSAEAAKVAAALDSRGAWVTEGKLRDHGTDDTTTRVIDSRVFIKNLLTLARCAAAKPNRYPRRLDSMNPAGLIFDCDGTLADTMPLHYEAWIATLAEYGLSLDEDRFYALGGWPTKSVAKLLADEAKLVVDLDRFFHEKETRFLTSLDRVTPIEPIVAEARNHRGKLPMAVATGATRDVCARILRTIGVLEWFDCIVAADDVPHHKPAPDVFLEAAKRLGVEPSRCLVYEDADPGIEAARRAGMKFVDVRTIYLPRRVTARRSA